ncbi:MAG TPA: hypothetical protein VHM01_21530 [Alphaproteobacteria bacterium]|nr:hypothetical protein [Alphaproteobacteria bacterium]
MIARVKSTLTEGAGHDALLEEPAIDAIDDALWHLQIEARRVAQLVAERGLDPAQRRDLQRALAVLRAAADWQPARTREPEPAL